MWKLQLTAQKMKFSFTDFFIFFCRDSYVDKGELLIDLKHVDMVSVL